METSCAHLTPGVTGVEVPPPGPDHPHPAATSSVPSGGGVFEWHPVGTQVDDDGYTTAEVMTFDGDIHCRKERMATPNIAPRSAAALMSAFAPRPSSCVSASVEVVAASF